MCRDTGRGQKCYNLPICSWNSWPLVDIMFFLLFLGLLLSWLGKCLPGEWGTNRGTSRFSFQNRFFFSKPGFGIFAVICCLPSIKSVFSAVIDQKPNINCEKETFLDKKHLYGLIKQTYKVCWGSHDPWQGYIFFFTF